MDTPPGSTDVDGPGSDFAAALAGKSLPSPGECPCEYFLERTALHGIGPMEGVPKAMPRMD